MWTFLGQGWKLCHSSGPSCCSDSASSLSYCSTREFPKSSFCYRCISLVIKGTWEQRAWNTDLSMGTCTPLPWGSCSKFKCKDEGFPLWRSGLRTRCCLCWAEGLLPGPTQWVKDLALLQLWCRSQLWLRIHPWPGNFQMLQEWQKKKKKKKKKRKQLRSKVRKGKILSCFHRACI